MEQPERALAHYRLALALLQRVSPKHRAIDPLQQDIAALARPR